MGNILKGKCFNHLQEKKIIYPQPVVLQKYSANLTFHNFRLFQTDGI